LRDFSLHKLNEPQKFFRLRRAEKKHVLKKNSFKLIPDTGPLLEPQNFRLRAEKSILSKNNFKLFPDSSAAVIRTSKFLRLRRAKRMFFKK